MIERGGSGTRRPRSPLPPSAGVDSDGWLIGRLVWSLVPSPAVTVVDRGVASLVGLSDPDRLREPGAVLRHVHPDDAGPVVRQLLSADGAGPILVRWRTADGELIVRQRASHRRDNRGRPVAVTVTLRSAEERPGPGPVPGSSDVLAHAAFRSAPAGLAVLARTSGRLIEVNHAFAALAGRDPASLHGAAVETVLELGDDAQSLRDVIHGRADRARVEVQLGGRWTLADAAADGELVVLHAVDITDRRAAEAELARAALYDTLTGLPNRRLLQDRLTQALARSERSGELLAVLFVDLDDFKVVNDARGHQDGDTVLQEVAHRLYGAVRSSDTVARLGGDEFVIVVSPLDHDRRAHLLADRIVDLVSAPVPLPGGAVRVGASVGVLVVPRSGGRAADVLHAADRAMYAAKAAGKGRWELVHLPAGA